MRQIHFLRNENKSETFGEKIERIRVGAGNGVTGNGVRSCYLPTPLVNLKPWLDP